MLIAHIMATCQQVTTDIMLVLNTHGNIRDSACPLPMPTADTIGHTCPNHTNSRYHLDSEYLFIYYLVSGIYWKHRANVFRIRRYTGTCGVFWAEFVLEATQGSVGRRLVVRRPPVRLPEVLNLLQGQTTYAAVSQF